MLSVLSAVVGGRRRRGSRTATPLRPLHGGGDRDAHPDDTVGAVAVPDDEELALAQRFVAGRRDALREVYDRYGGAVHTAALAVLGDRQLAAEAAQVTFLKAWRSADRFDASRPLAPWLYSIARRAAIDVGRRERRHAGTGPLVESDAVTTTLGIEHAWEAWQVRSAVDRLGPDERDVVRLQHFEQLTHREIGERLGMPVGTVKSRSHRAHRRLARELAHLRELEVAR